VPGAPPAAANPDIRNQATPRPDPFAAYWSLIPASRAGAMAWQPPFFPSSNPFSPENIAAPKWVTPPPMFLNSPGQSLLPAAAHPTAPRPDTGYGLLGALANLPQDAEYSRPFQRVQLELHAQDKDREASGWAAIPRGITDKRLRMRLVDGVVPSELWGRDHVHGDIIIKFKRVGTDMVPTEIHLTRVLP
jgi:hypothetical protein